jgi:hypothetical protein
MFSLLYKLTGLRLALYAWHFALTIYFMIRYIIYYVHRIQSIMRDYILVTFNFVYVRIIEIEY